MIYKGNPVSAGIAIGSAFVYDPKILTAPEDAPVLPMECELERYENAVQAAQAKLREIQAAFTGKDDDKAEIFSAHLDMVDDEEISEEIRSAIHAGTGAAKAVEQVNRNDSDRKIKKIGQDFMKRFTGGRKEEADTAEKVHSYIIENISEELSVEELAAMVYLSQNQLARVFKKKYGKTVIEFIMGYRMNLAEELLKDTRFTVTEVSAKIGYPNYAYFTKLFKKHSGYTPSAYRNRFVRKS